MQEASPTTTAIHSSAAPRWIAARVAHPVHDLDRSAAFYRDLLGLQPSGGFTGHEGYSGVFFTLPGGGGLELTTGPGEVLPSSTDDLVVLYLASPEDARRQAEALVSAGVRTVPSADPYWDRRGQRGLALASSRSFAAPRQTASCRTNAHGSAAFPAQSRSDSPRQTRSPGGHGTEPVVESGRQCEEPPGGHGAKTAGSWACLAVGARRSVAQCPDPGGGPLAQTTNSYIGRADIAAAHGPGPAEARR